MRRPVGVDVPVPTLFYLARYECRARHDHERAGEEARGAEVAADRAGPRAQVGARPVREPVKLRSEELGREAAR